MNGLCRKLFHQNQIEWLQRKNDFYIYFHLILSFNTIEIISKKKIKFEVMFYNKFLIP